MTTIKFGWHMPSFPTDGSNGPAFRDQIIDTLGPIQNSFDSAWADDHLHPWAEWQPSDTVAVECLATLTYLSGFLSLLQRRGHYRHS